MNHPEPSKPISEKLTSKKGKKSEALWMASFSDMCLVLLCFFVLMMSIMKPDKKKYEHMKDGLSAKVTEKKEQNLHQLPEEISKIIEEKKLSQAAQVNFDSDGLHIEFKDGLLFKTGSAAPNPKFQKITDEVLQVISTAKSRYSMKIEGHTDDLPLRKSGKYPSNWELSAARGFTLMRNFKEFGVPEEQLSVVAYAHTKPKVAIEGLKGRELKKARAANRRVVIWIE